MQLDEGMELSIEAMQTRKVSHQTTNLSIKSLSEPSDMITFFKWNQKAWKNSLRYG